MRHKKSILLAGAVVLLTGALLYWRLTSPPRPSSGGAGRVGPADDGRAGPAADGVRRRLLGVWQDHYQGKRTMTLNDDGTGTMVVELDGVRAALFASRLRFDMRWSLDGPTLRKTTVGGEPADKVNLILNTMGDTARDTIVEVTEDRLVLLDRDGKTRYEWGRVRGGDPGGR